MAKGEEGNWGENEKGFALEQVSLKTGRKEEQSLAERGLGGLVGAGGH